MDSRAYRDGDLRLLLELCQELWPDVRVPFGQVAFGTMQARDLDARLWFDGGRLVAWGARTGAELTYEGRADVLDEVLDWGRPESVAATRLDEELLARHVLTFDAAGPSMRTNARALADLAEPAVPSGYRLTTMAEYGDVSARTAGHRAAWGTLPFRGGDVHQQSRFTDDFYAGMRVTWPYRADLDCLAVAPDGTVACTLICWLDERNRVGELEPVGTAPEHRRLGLASALCLFALRRLREAGGELCLVGSRGDADYPVPSLVYESVGFREIGRRVTFRS